MNPEERPVSVWYMGLDDENNPYAALEALRTIYIVMGEDFESAWRIVHGCRGKIAGPVSLEAGEVIITWLASVGAMATIDDDDYDEEAKS